MPISEKEFSALTGAPKKVGGVDPNSMAQRCLKALPSKGGLTAEEVISAAKVSEEEISKLKQALNALTYDKVKGKNGERVTKVIKKHDDEHIAYFKLNPEYQWGFGPTHTYRR